MVKQKVYKVVYRKGSRQYESTYAPEQFSKSYRTGRVTRPVKGTKLFCFLKLEDAQLYSSMKGKHLHRIYLAEAENVMPNVFLNTYVFDLGKLISFFICPVNAHRSMMYKSSAACDSIKLLKQVKV